MELGSVDDKAFGDAARKIMRDLETVTLGNLEARLLAHIDEAITDLIARMETGALQRGHMTEHLVEIKRQQAIDGERIAANSDRIGALEAWQAPLTAEEIRGVLATVTRMAAVVDQLLDHAVGGS